MTHARTRISKRPSSSETLAKELGLLRDEVRSVGETLRTLTKEFAISKYGVPSTHDLEAIKAELRLIRDDISTLDKKLSLEAKLTA